MSNVAKNLGKLALAACFFSSTFAAGAQADGIGVTWFGKSGMAKRVLSGFEERMAEIAPEWEIEVRGELEDAHGLAAAYADLRDTHGGVVVLRSNGSKWLAQNQPETPTFIGGGNHPPSLGVIENMEAPEGNITGVTYYLDPTIVLETFSAVKLMESVLFLQQEGHPGTEIDKQGFSVACEELFIECTFVLIPDSAALAQAIVDNPGHDAVMLGNQAPLYDDETNFRAAVEAAGTMPIFGMHRKIPEMGGLATLGANDEKLGRYLADRVVAVMRDGISISNTPVGTDEAPVLILNTSTQERLGISVPAQMIQEAELLS